MKKTIITTSVLALFAGASWAVENNVVFENKTIERTGESNVLINGGYASTTEALTVDSLSFKDNSLSTTATGANSGIFGGVYQVKNSTLVVKKADI